MNMWASELDVGTPCPDQITLFGGGRWARIITQSLCELLSPAVQISIYSPHNADAMSAWVYANGLTRQVTILYDKPVFNPALVNAAIVANAARDHEWASTYALEAGVPVLVEKPLTLTIETAQRLVTLATLRGVQLAPASVFLFARYIENFAAIVKRAGPIQSIRIHWEDPRRETRHGEQKQFDSTLPIFSDLLPHISSIIGLLSPGQPQDCVRLKAMRGGAEVALDLSVGTSLCQALLIRNGSVRKRIVSVSTTDETISLDFSDEPGRIDAGSVSRDADPDWPIARRPLASMLTAFLQGSASGIFDPRFNPSLGLQACRLINQAQFLYKDAMQPWLAACFEAKEPLNDDLTYARNESTQAGLSNTER